MNLTVKDWLQVPFSSILVTSGIIKCEHPYLTEKYRANLQEPMRFNEFLHRIGDALTSEECSSVILSGVWYIHRNNATRGGQLRSFNVYQTLGGVMEDPEIRRVDESVIYAKNETEAFEAWCDKHHHLKERFTQTSPITWSNYFTVYIEEIY